MKLFGKIALIISVACICCSSLCACIPPFIDGAVEASDYFQEAVNYDTYAINPDAEGGFDIVNGNTLSLDALSDNDENNILMRNYLEFTFTAKSEIALKILAFIVEVDEESELNFRLSYGTSTFDKSIDLNTKKKDIIQFDGLDLNIAVSEKIVITLINPIVAHVNYRIDSVIFII